MNPILEEIYSTIIPSAPYVIAAYVLIMVVVFIWLFKQYKSGERLAKRIALLEEEIEEKSLRGIERR